jgi:hypothetical protein
MDAYESISKAIMVTRVRPFDHIDSAGMLSVAKAADQHCGRALSISRCRVFLEQRVVDPLFWTFCGKRNTRVAPVQ